MRARFALALCLAIVLPTGSTLGADASGDNDSEDLGKAETIDDRTETPSFGGPSSVSAQVDADAERQSQSWYRFKSGVAERHGLSFGGDYNAMYQGASESLGEDNAAGGILRLFGTWTLTGRGTPDRGSLVFKVEHRHRIATDIPPQSLASEIGYAGLTSVLYSDAGALLTNLYWQQSFKHRQWAFVAGLVDTTDYVAIHGLVNPWTDFSNLSFSTDPTIPVPNQGMGAALRGKLSEHWYLLAGFADTNGDPGDPLDSASDFFSDFETFKHVEIGWVSSWENRFTDNIHVTLWQADERDAAAVSDGWGASFSYSRKVSERWMTFFRAGWSDGGGTLLDRSLGGGVGYFRQGSDDVLGIGVHGGRPAEGTFGKGMDRQFTVEAYYRIQLFPHMTVTPMLQLLMDPALNPEENRIWVLGLRSRINF